MVFPSINLLAVVVAAIVGFVIGGIWYAPPVFGNTWMRLLGKKREELGVMQLGPLMTSFIGTLITSYVLAVFIGYAGAKTTLDGAIIGLWAWFGFVITVTASDAMFERKPAKLPLINGAFSLVIFLVMGAIIGVWM